MTFSELQQRFSQVKIAVIGDFCLDMYIYIESSVSEVSLESGLPTRSVSEFRVEPGGAANVVKHLASLGAGKVQAFGIIGDDMPGRELVRQLEGRGIDCSGLVPQPENWATNCFVKPHLEMREQSRVDFGNYNVPSEQSIRRVIEGFERALDGCSAAIINQQLLTGIQTAEVRPVLAQCIKNHPETLFFVDSRAYGNDFPGAIHKVNLVEAALAAGTALTGEQLESPGDDELLPIARKLLEKWRKPVIITLGELGVTLYDGTKLSRIQGIHQGGIADPVGAGDAFLAGIAAAMCAGADLAAAGIFGNFCAAVTVGQRFTTGEIYPDELKKMAEDPDYVYNPSLAGDARRARHLADTGIEIITTPAARPFPQFAVFDHDGTISTLRQGWEEVMREVMIDAVTGHGREKVPVAVYETIAREVGAFIAATTGIRTIEQMRGLVRLVKDFRMVPAGDIHTPGQYKRIYLDRLEEKIRERTERLASGIFGTDDFTIKGSAAFLERLRREGVTLFLASGTDHDSVMREAAALGYAKVFNGGIFGAHDDIDEDPKKAVVRDIFKKIDVAGGHGLAVFGDGPVEIREARKRNALSVGVASDEVRRYGFNAAKRSRLIRAGADIIIPDFADPGAVYRALGWECRHE